jgi:PAS domain-containing protein
MAVKCVAEDNPMKALVSWLQQREDWLMERILGFARRYGYSAYTSTLKEPWRLSISGLSASLIEATARPEEIMEIHAGEDLPADPVAQFGVVEAQRHKERGISLIMFLGLMKYYRQAYLDLIVLETEEPGVRQKYAHFVNRAFDRIEIAFCAEWSAEGKDKALLELQTSNRLMTNEKNRYLTIFESIPNPVIILNRFNKIENMNLAAARSFKDDSCSGSQYYCLSRDRHLELG